MGFFVVERPDWARIRVTGSDRAAYLHNLVTNEVKKLQPGEGRPAAIVNQRAGVLDWVVVYAGAEEHWVLGGPGRVEADLAWMDRYLITEDVQLEDQTAASGLLYMSGEGAQERLETLVPAFKGVPEFGWLLADVAGVQTRVLRTHGLLGAGYFILTPAAESKAVREALGGDTVADDALERARIEQGLPLVGRDLDESRNPWEGRLDGSISLDKGCYLGQEIVARLHAYDKVQRYLVGLRWESGSLPPVGAKLFDGEREVGQLTSAIQGASGGIGLGFAKADQARPGQVLALRANEGTWMMTVEDRPFWAGKTRPVTSLTRERS